MTTTRRDSLDLCGYVQLNGLMFSCTLPLQGPDGKWNQYTGRYAWDASCIVSNQREEFGGTGASKKEEVFEAAPNIDHSNVSVFPCQHTCSEASQPGITHGTALLP